MNFPQSVNDFSDHIDELIRKQISVDAFDLPSDFIAEVGTVDVICSTYEQELGLHFILKISCGHSGEAFYCKITSGDGGVIIGKSNLTKDINSLLTSCEEDWSYF